MKRVVALLPVLVALQVGVQPALAWTWPVDGPVLRPFVLGDDPYAAGQHRGIDVGAAAGAPVRAPAGGNVSFAGTVPGGGRTVTIRTAEGYAVTLLHLGSVGVSRGAVLLEGEVLGSVGPSGDAEVDGPYVHLGVRLAGDPNGYVDPLGLLPARPVAEDPAEQPVPADEPVPNQPEPEHRSGEDMPAQPSAKEGPGRKSHPEAADVGSAAHASETSPGLVRRARLRAVEDGVAPTSRERRGPDNLSASGRLYAPRRAFDGPLARDVPPSSAAVGSRGRGVKAGPGLPSASAGFAAAGALAACAAVLAILRRKLRDAVPTDCPSPVLLDRSGLAAEHAGVAGLAEQDRLVLDRDLERILLREAEPLPDLDGDDDPSELVDVPDDPRRRRSSCARRRAHRAHFPRSGRSRAPVTPAC
jgi:Peptidase family M23